MREDLTTASGFFAISVAARMLDFGREQAARHGIDNVEFRLGDMEEPPVDAASVDLVFFSQSLHHALHPERAVQQAARVLVIDLRMAGI